MKIITIIRYLKSFIVFKANGGFTDRFINLCARHNINLFDMHYINNSLVASVPLNQIYFLKNICKKSGVTLELVSKKGLYFTAKKYNNRKALLAGVFFYFIFCVFMQQFIWSIDIQESQKVSKQEFTEKLSSHSLYFGTYKKNFDEVNCARKIVNELEGKIQWMAINIKGSKAFVEIHDYNTREDESTYSDPCNIVSDFDGIILSIEAYKGEEYAKKGEAVSKGDLLISGIVENRDLSTSYFEARGKVTALHDVKIEKNYNIKNKYEVFDDWKSSKYIYILGIKIPIIFSSFNESHTIYINNCYCCFTDETLPFGKIEKTNCIKSDNLKVLSEKESCLLSLESYCNTIYKEFSNTNVVNYNIQLSLSESSIKISGEYSCIDFMGEKQIINNEFF